MALPLASYSTAISLGTLVGLIALPTLPQPATPATKMQLQTTEGAPSAKPVLVARRVKTKKIPPEPLAEPEHGKDAEGPPADEPKKSGTPAKPEPTPEAANSKPIAPAAPPSVATPEPPPDIWTDAEIIAGLQDCLQRLAPIAAQIDIAPPMKKGQCGSSAPVSLRRIGSGAGIEFRPAPVTNCRVVAGLYQWVEKVLQPTAREMLDSPIVRIVGSSSYSCRNRYGHVNDKISEHAFANAIDIGGFVTADGREISVLRHWGPTHRDQSAEHAGRAKQVASADGTKGRSTRRDVTPVAVKSGRARGPASDDAMEMRWLAGEGPVPDANVAAPAKTAEAEQIEAMFLRRLHKGACGIFGTVLGPEANEAHRNHFHFDMAARKRNAFCE